MRVVKKIKIEGLSRSSQSSLRTPYSSSELKYKDRVSPVPNNSD